MEDPSGISFTLCAAHHMFSRKTNPEFWIFTNFWPIKLVLFNYFWVFFPWNQSHSLKNLGKLGIWISFFLKREGEHLIAYKKTFTAHEEMIWHELRSISSSLCTAAGLKGGSSYKNWTKTSTKICKKISKNWPKSTQKISKSRPWKRKPISYWSKTLFCSQSFFQLKK